MVSENQLPHKIVNLLCTLTNENSLSLFIPLSRVKAGSSNALSNYLPLSYTLPLALSLSLSHKLSLD